MTNTARRQKSVPVLLFLFTTMLLAAGLATATPAAADVVFFSTGDPDGKIATLSRTSAGGKLETESADDFLLSTPTRITGATFTGLLTSGASLVDIDSVTVEVYRVFPKDSTDPPSGNVPTRANSPSDVALDSRDSVAGSLSFSVTALGSFTAANSVVNGINKIPNQNTLGEGSVTGEEVQFDVDFITALNLPPDHYFFVPQVDLSSGDFLWLSAPKPIVAPGTPFLPDLQSWIRNANLAPDWLRVGTDIVGGTSFNAAFSLSGSPVPEPGTVLLLGAGLTGLAALRKKRGSRGPHS